MNRLKILSLALGRPARNAAFWLVTALVFFPDGARWKFFPLFLLTIAIFFGAPAYFHNLMLVPRLLLRQRYGGYTLAMAVLLPLAIVLTHTVVPLLAYLPDFRVIATIDYLTCGIVCTLALVLLSAGKFMSDTVQYKARYDALQQQQTESELQALRSQINPHFLFNALNTIYGMALRAEAQTPDTVLQLSNILRHSLYRSMHPLIAVDEEVAFLLEYIAFARLRMDNKRSLTLSTDIAQPGLRLAPLLLIPFIENALKHGLGKEARGAWARISLRVADGRLDFLCENSLPPAPPVPKGSGGGIGLKNVARRLELLYESRHTLHIAQDEDIFRVTLQLQLT